MVEAPCPSFPGVMYASMVYNKGCIPWDLEFYNGGAMSGNTGGAYFQWYRYREGSPESSATPCDWQTDHTTCAGFKPATDEDQSRYIYFCKVTTTLCPEGVKSGLFTVVIGSPTDPCPTFAGTSFSIISGGGSYTSGQTVTLTASTNAYGGDHIYTWYHNGEPLDESDPRYTFTWDFNLPKLIITNVQPADGGTYSVMMQDGTECFLYTNPVRVLVDNPVCGPVPNLAVSKAALCEGETASTSVTNNTLASGEIGEFLYMVQPEGSHPSTTPGTWTTDMPGLYQFKYVVNNPDNPSCFRESKVVTIRVYGSGATPTITPDVTLIKYSQTLHFTCSAPEAGETAKITWTNDQGQSGDIYPNTYPNFAHTCYTAGTYTYTYTLTNPQAGCSRTATCEVVWYQCEWGTPYWGTWYADNAHYPVGTAINLNPTKPSVRGMSCVFTYTLDGGTPVEIDPTQPFTPTVPGTYVFSYSFKHSDPRVTDCFTTPITKTLIIDPCGTVAELSTNKTTLKLGESASLTYPAAESGESATLSYTLNSGAPVSLPCGEGGGGVITPSAPGTYVLTYSITTSCGTTSASVTIHVYDCGPEATITASRTTVRPNDPVTLTLSAIGADETATLIYTIDGGAPISLPCGEGWGGVFTPHDEGTYTFTYQISHPYIDCTRSASVTVSVSDCGTAVLLTADKSVLTLGETVSLTTSRGPDANETATLTYTINGGAPVSIPCGEGWGAFTPSAVGTYVVIYKLYNSLLDCETSSEVTFSVYECGPAISLEVDKSILRLGEGVNLTLSTLGADETATLSCTLNGGTPVSLPCGEGWGGVVTPSAAGTYIFTYTITHPYIDCTRSASATVTVYDCGTPASITVDKTVLALGEPLHLTLSSLLPEETATLSYTLNGGAPVSLPCGEGWGGVVTPSSEGTYVFTYTVSHTIIDCETSAQVTVTVYACGPEATITLSKEETKILRPIDITLSAPGADETAILSYTINGGAPVSLPCGEGWGGVITPTELGTYVFTYTITHAYIPCTRTVTATLTVVEAELVFDDNNGTHLWSDPKNWWPAYNRLPNIADSAIIRRDCKVDIAQAITYDLTFEGGSIAIQPTGALVVAHQLLQTSQNSISVLSDPTGNGALVLGPDNTHIPAAVQCYSSATDKNELYPVWQYIGSPVQEPLSIVSSYPQAVLYEWTNTPNKQVGGNWQRIDSLVGSVLPFTGYCITQSKPTTYPLQGTLNDPAPRSVNIPYNDQGSYPGFAFVANSWVAPIDIASLEVSDFGAADATVYIMNAGTYSDAIKQQSASSSDGTAAAKGQYNAIPVHAASYLPNALSVIPPMQGFFVHTHTATTLTLDYNKAVYTPALTKVSTTPTRAPSLSPQDGLSTFDFRLLTLRVSGFGSEDEVYLMESPEFTTAFENGWDGRKMRSEKSDISLAVAAPDGDLAVAALPELEGTEIVFNGSNHKTYTLEVSPLPRNLSPVTSPLYLLDRETGVYTLLDEGASYSFKCGAAPRRFVIVRQIGGTEEQTSTEKIEAVKFIEDGLFYIRYGNRLYNGNGKLLENNAL